MESSEQIASHLRTRNFINEPFFFPLVIFFVAIKRHSVPPLDQNRHATHRHPDRIIELAKTSKGECIEI